MSDQELETVEVETGPRPGASVIWLHGLGADGHDFEPIVPQLAAAGLDNVRFVFPHAPIRPVTINGGMPMRAWYDIVSFDAGPPRDREGIAASRLGIEALILREEQRGSPPDNIVLAGFSQGGAMALFTGLRLDRALAGIMGLSTYLLMAPTTEAERSSENSSTPVFMAHGTFDQVIPCAGGQRSAAILAEIGYQVEWHEYPMMHAVCPEEIGHIGSWLRRCLGRTPSG